MSAEERCAGHCCRVFSLPYGPGELAEVAGKVRDGEQIAAMVIYLGHGPASAFPGAPPLDPSHFYTCSNHDPVTGDCRAYESRPSMCSDFPYGKPCPYPECAVPHYTIDVPVQKLLRKRWKRELAVRTEALP